MLPPHGLDQENVVASGRRRGRLFSPATPARDQPTTTSLIWITGAPATYVGMCHIFSDTVEAFQAGMAKHGKEILGDIPNYTDIAPVIQISEVVVG